MRITMESYRLFLDQWSRLTPELKEKYSHPDQPDKQNATHVPSDWGSHVEGRQHSGRQMERKKDPPRSPRRQRHFLGCLGLCGLKPVEPGEPRYRLPSRQEWMALGALMETGERGIKPWSLTGTAMIMIEDRHMRHGLRRDGMDLFRGKGPRA